MSVSPEYKGCTATILGNVTPTTVTTNGCVYVLSFGARSDATTATGKTHLACPAGKKIETHVWKTDAEHTANSPAFCTYTMGAQTAGGQISYSINATHDVLSYIGTSLVFFVERTGGTLTNCGKAVQTAEVSIAAHIEAFVTGAPQSLTFS